MNPALKPSLAEDEIDRIIGPRALFDIGEPLKHGGPSPPVLYRARRAGLIELTDVGGRTKISRALMKQLLLKGLPRVPFQYSSETPVAQRRRSKLLTEATTP